MGRIDSRDTGRGNNGKENLERYITELIRLNRRLLEERTLSRQLSILQKIYISMCLW